MRAIVTTHLEQRRPMRHAGCRPGLWLIIHREPVAFFALLLPSSSGRNGRLGGSAEPCKSCWTNGKLAGTTPSPNTEIEIGGFHYMQLARWFGAYDEEPPLFCGGLQQASATQTPWQEKGQPEFLSISLGLHTTHLSRVRTLGSPAGQRGRRLKYGKAGCHLHETPLEARYSGAHRGGGECSSVERRFSLSPHDIYE